MRAFLLSTGVGSRSDMREASSNLAKFAVQAQAFTCATVLLLHLGTVVNAAPACHVLENARLRIQLEPKGGTISCIRDKCGEIDLVAVDGLADVFRLVV